MKNENTLPTIARKKKINITEFEKLAKKVKDIFEEEANYLEKKNKNENNNSSRFSANS
jgi:hypothetical protein